MWIYIVILLIGLYLGMNLPQQRKPVIEEQELTEQVRGNHLKESERKEIFKSLYVAEQLAFAIAESGDYDLHFEYLVQATKLTKEFKEIIAKENNLTVEQIRNIEREGLRKGWPDDILEELAERARTQE